MFDIDVRVQVKRKDVHKVDGNSVTIKWWFSILSNPRNVCNIFQIFIDGQKFTYLSFFQKIAMFMQEFAMGSSKLIP